MKRIEGECVIDPTASKRSGQVPGVISVHHKCSQNTPGNGMTDHLLSKQYLPLSLAHYHRELSRDPKSFKDDASLIWKVPS